MAGKVNGTLVDASTLIEQDATLQMITAKDDRRLRSYSSLNRASLGSSRQTIISSAQVTIGPVIENGFFYDFLLERSFTPEDLSAIEKKMGIGC